jgi:hypothetical protein
MRPVLPAPGLTPTVEPCLILEADPAPQSPASIHFMTSFLSAATVDSQPSGVASWCGLGEPAWASIGLAGTGPAAAPVVLAGTDEEDDEELGEDEDLTVAPPADDESNFDDFDDEFDDDFEEDEDDPDWDHPDDGEAEPPPGKAPGKKK